MNKEYDLNNFGINLSISLIGDLKVLRCEADLPTLFLFDENHSNLDNCIYKNILNALELIEKGNIFRVGVESLAGGKSWDSENQEYNEYYFDKKFDDQFVKKYKSQVTTFADELERKFKNLISGVECWGMMENITKDILAGKYSSAATHPFNIKRSQHFVRTMFERYNVNEGNLILNCGSNHNNHIEKWIESGEIDNIAGLRANYIRINTITV